jgi:protein TonB
MRDMKKTAKADLESKRALFIEIGLALALLFVILAFEMKSYDKNTIDLAQRQVENVEEEIAQITEQNQPPPPPPPPQQQTTIIEIVDDDVEVEEDLEIDVEADEETEAEEYVPPVEEEEEEEDNQIFTVVEDNPEFKGGQAALMKFLAKNITYPQMAKETGIQGTVYVRFVVEKDGHVSQVKIARGIGGGCDEEAMRVVKMMPKWKAGRQRGKAVRVNFTLPVKFVLK